MSAREAFTYQARACASLGSPFMDQLCTLFATRAWPDGRLKDRIFSWPGDITPRGDSVPLRLTGGLHALRLTGDERLATVYPPTSVDDDRLWDTVCDVMQREEAFLDRWIDSAPQTNEVRRSCALIAAGHVLADRFGLPITTSELGASGGLNLNWAAYGLKIGKDAFGADDPVLTLNPDWSGPLPPAATPRVSQAAGVDLNPLDPQDPNDRLRLLAYLWPDQPHRVALTEAAIGAADRTVVKQDAIEWLETRLSPMDGQTHMIYSTVAWQYFPKAAQDRGAALIEEAGRGATDNAPLAWFGMENDGGERGAALTLRLWPGDLTFHLGRADFHGRWVDWKGI